MDGWMNGWIANENENENENDTQRGWRCRKGLIGVVFLDLDDGTQPNCHHDAVAPRTHTKNKGSFLPDALQTQDPQRCGKKE